MANLCSIFRRRLSSAKYYRKSADPKTSRNIRTVDFSEKNEGCCSRANVWERSFCSAASGDFKLSRDNVLSSPFAKLTFTDDLLHEFVWKNLDRWPDKTAVVCAITGRSYTYAQLRKLSGRLATTFRKLKFYPGDTIAIVLPNIPEFAIVVLGASEAGLQVTLVNGAYTADEIDRQLKNAGASAVITIPKFAPVVRTSVAHNPNIRMPVIVIDDGSGSSPDDSVKFSELIADGVEEFSEIGKPGRLKGDTLFLPYSSGTTGFPKGVELSHSNIVANCMQIQKEEVCPGNETTKTHQEVVPGVLPFFHIYGLTVVLLNHLSMGAKLVCLPQFNTDDFLRCLKDFRPTLLHAAPPIILFMGDHEGITSEHLDSIKHIMSGAAPIGLETVERLLRRTSRKINVVQGWGLSETSPVVTVGRISGQDDFNSVGPALSNTELRVVKCDGNNDGENVGVGEVGEVLVRGPQVMKGYYKNPEATANAMDGEWFKSGDLGYFNDKGLLFITDRLKELIKVKGFQVAPAELEEILRSNGKVLDAAVIGQPHERFGEIPRAFVVPRPGVKLDEDEIKAFVDARVAKYKQLGSVKFVDFIPKSATGKILRRQLKEQ